MPRQHEVSQGKTRSQPAREQVRARPGLEAEMVARQRGLVDRDVQLAGLTITVIVLSKQQRDPEPAGQRPHPRAARSRAQRLAGRGPDGVAVRVGGQPGERAGDDGGEVVGDALGVNFSSAGLG